MDTLMCFCLFICLFFSFSSPQNCSFFQPADADVHIAIRLHMCKYESIDPPSFLERPQNIESEMGENITMNCLVDSNPKADIVWVFDPIDRVSYPEKNLSKLTRSV